MYYKVKKNYATNRLLYKLIDDRYMDKTGKIKDNLKFNINISEFRIKDSMLIQRSQNEPDTYLFLPHEGNRKGEGGLRTKGYFKFSYEKKGNKWWIVDNKSHPLKKVDIDENLFSDFEKLPLISIITVVYNGEEYLEETIKSVISQTYPNIEYIIIDGGSTDGTIDIIKKYEDFIDYWISEPDSGIYDAMNKGIKLANGIWINFMNSGDSFANSEVLTKVNFHRYREKSLIYGNKIQNGKVVFPVDVSRLEVGEIMACHQAMFFNKSILGHELFYKTKYKIYGDYELVNRIYLRNERRLAYINEVICVFRGDGISSKKSFRKRMDKYSILLKSYGIYGLLRGVIFRIRKGIL